MIHQTQINKNWKEENLSPFDELMVSWNAARPTDGAYHFYVSVKTDEWSPWMLYASWGSEGQSSFSAKNQEGSVRVFQDALEVVKGEKASGFQIKIVPEGNALLENVYGLHVYMNSERLQEPKESSSYFQEIYLQVPGLSQMTLNHPRHADLCSPTSSTAVSRYLSKNKAIDPVSFANSAFDHGFDLFGNWVLNVAQASSELGREWSCWVERLSGFEEIYHRLHQGTPVIVSVRGPLAGSALPYAKGHLMVVIGYEPLQKRVLCMDPAFSSDEQTHVFYDLSDFVQAWNRRGRVAYIFSKN